MIFDQIVQKNGNTYILSKILQIHYIQKTLHIFRMRKLDLHKMMPSHKRVLDSKTHRLPHYIYPVEQMQKIKVTHVQPAKMSDRFALLAVRFFRSFYDATTRFRYQNMTENRWINRCIFLETVAGVPGMVGGMCRHLRSIRRFQRDKGFIHHLLEEADNERFHLFVFLNFKKKSSRLMGLMILTVQGLFMNALFLAYLIRPRVCHRFVGYLQQQAVKTYTAMLSQIDRKQSHISKWATQKAPQQAIDYYHLSQKATMRDVILCIRADQSTHRDTNHFLSQAPLDYEIKQENIFMGKKKMDQV